MSKSRDIDDLSIKESVVRDAVSDKGLGEGVAALTGKKVKSGAASQNKQASGKKAPVVKSPVTTRPNSAGSATKAVTPPLPPATSEVDTDESDEDLLSSSEISGDVYRLRRQMENLHNDMARVVRECSGLPGIIEKQSKELSELSSIVKRQSATIASMEAQIHKEQSLRDKMKIDLEADYKKRIQDGIDALRSTPEIIERLLQSANTMLASVPLEVQQGLKKLELTPSEKATVEHVRKQTTPAKVRIPKHFR